MKVMEKEQQSNSRKRKNISHCNVNAFSCVCDIELLAYAYVVMLIYNLSFLCILTNYIARYVAHYVNQNVELVILKYARDAFYAFDAWRC